MDEAPVGEISPVSDRSSDATAGVGKRMAKGAAWMIGARFAVRGIGLVSTVILARLLLPADFGLVTLAAMLLALLEMMSEFSFDVVLIQNKTAGRAHYDTAWTLSLIRGAVVAALLLALAAPGAIFFAEPRVEAIAYCLTLVAVVSGFANIGIVDFRKNLQFGKDMAYIVGVKLGSFATTLVLALMWRDYWALVAGMVVGAFLRVALSYAMHGYRPRLSLAEWRGIMEFSTWLLVNNVLRFFFHRSDTFVIAKLADAHALGLYTIAYEVSNLATSEIVAPTRRALFPGYVKLAAEPEALRENFVATLSLVLAMAAPVAVGILLVADPLVRTVLGDKWINAIPLIQVLALYGFLGTCTSNTGPTYLALGRPRLLTLLFVVGLAVKLPLLVWGTHLAGPYGAAWAATAGATAKVVVDLCVIIRVLRLAVGDLAAAVWRTAAATLGMAAAVHGTALWLPTGETFFDTVIELVSLVLVGAACYLLLHFGLWRACGCPKGAEQHVLSALREASARLNLVRTT